MKKFIEELKRRNVIKASIAYLVVAWVLLQVLSLLLPMVEAAEWLLPTITLIMAIGLPIWIIISWVYEITPEGVEKTAKVSENDLVTEMTNKRLNIFIIVSLSIAVIVLGLKLSNSSSDADERYAIAVLPFENMNVDKDNDWIGKGLTIDIHTYLSKIENLTIISEKSVKEALDSERSLPEIAELLKVTHFVGGSVRQFKNDIKISVHLTEVSTDKDPWAEIYNRNLDNPFKVQQDVSRKIVAQLKVELTPEEEKILQKYPTENMEAYALFTKGRLINMSRQKEDLELNIKLNEQAIVLDPNFAEAYVEVAYAYYLLWTYGEINIKEWNEVVKKKVNNYVEKALNLDPNTFRAYSIKAMLLWSHKDKDWDLSREYLEKAIAINPNDAGVRLHYGRYFKFRPNRDNENFLIQVTIAQRLNPLARVIGGNYINALISNDKFNEAEEYLDEMGFLFGKYKILLKKMHIKLYKNKDWTEQIRFYKVRLEKDPNNSDLNMELGKAYDEILNDDINFLKYAKKAYELDSTRIRFADHYYRALLENKKFNKAKELYQSDNFRELYNEEVQLNQLWAYYYFQENFKKAEEVLNNISLMEYTSVPFYKLLTYAQLGDRKKVDSILNDYYELNRTKYWLNIDKAIVFAIMKEKDSMYHYLDKLRPIKDFHQANSRFEFDPYRKEERFKALLRKHYLPITHWNE